MQENESIKILGKWMDLEKVVLSEVIMTEKEMLCSHFHLCLLAPKSQV